MLDEGGRLKGRLNIDDRLVSQLRRGYAYVLILRRVYGVDVELDYTPILTVPDRDTGLDRHFRLLFDSQFVDVEVVGERPPLPDDVRRRLQAMLLEPGAMERILPPDRFVLRGVTFLKAIDVTDQEVLSALKRDLIDRESIVSPDALRRAADAAAHAAAPARAAPGPGRAGRRAGAPPQLRAPRSSTPASSRTRSTTGRRSSSAPSTSAR